MRTRNTTLVVVFAFLIHFFGVFTPFNVSAEETAQIPPAMQEKAELLNKLGFFEGYGNEYFTLDKVLTKAEVCVLTLKVINKADIYSGISRGQYIFDDVSSDHWGADAIYFMKSLGVINGDEGRFYPEHEATSEQAVKMLVCALGYDMIASRRGGWPTGYTSTAQSMDLFKGVKLSEKISYGEFIMLVYNAFDVSFFKPSSYSDGDTVYKLDPDDKETILSIRDIYKVKGQITANEYSSLIPGKSGTALNSVEIDGDIYDCGTTDISLYLGYDAEVYYKEDDSENTVLAYTLKNKEGIRINAADIENADIKEIEYYKEGNKRSRVKIADGAVLIYNGVAEPMDKKLLTPYSGEIVFVDSDISGKSSGYDIVIVNEYRHFIVDGITTDGEIYLKNHKADEASYIDAEDAKVIKDGNDTDISSITKGSIISVLRSLNNEYLVIEILDTLITGAVTSLNSDEEVAVDGKVYEISKEFSVSSGAELRTGNEGDFYLDRYGKIFYFESDRADNNYGFMMNSSYDENEEKLYIKILTVESEAVKLEFADKVKAVNYPYKGQNTTLKPSDYGNFVNNLRRTLFIYDINDEGRINKIELPVQGNVDGRTDDFSLDYTLSSGLPYAYGRIGEFMLNSNTRHFVITENNGIYDDKKSTVYKKTNYMDSNSEKHGSQDNPIYFYDVKKNGEVGAILEFGDNTKSFKNSENLSIALVDRLYQSVNADGEVVDSVSVYNNGALASYNASEDAGALTSSLKELKDIKCGDILFYEKDKQGDIDKYQIIFDASDPKEGKLAISGGGYADVYSTAVTVFSGYVYYIDDTAIRLNYNGQYITFNFAGSCTYYRCDLSRKKCYPAQKSEIKCIETDNVKDNSFVVLQANRNTINTVIIYE